MQGTIRIILGLLLTMGGVGGIEADTSSVFPLDSLAIALLGLALMAWAVVDINKATA